MLQISQKAADKVQSLLQDPEQSGKSYLRISVLSGGCSGLSYRMDFEADAQPEDQRFEDKCVQLLCDKKSLVYLIGTELDFSDGLNGKGFHFNNPNAARSCACGESFSL
ncbi:MAG: HesB/IscA family protein [Bacteroidota bacterium]